MHVRTLRRLLVALLAATALALLWNEFGMDSVLVIDAGSPYQTFGIDDRSSPGGGSVATLSRENRRLGLDCQITNGYQWPYCELQVQFDTATHGLDLSRFDTMRVWISATGPEPKQRIRLMMLNFDPAYSKPTDPNTQKVLTLNFEPSLYPRGYEIPLSQFNVASWWIDEHPMTLDLLAPDFRNITVLSFATGAKVEEGLHRIRIDRIELHGKLILPSTFRLAIIALWMLSMFGYLVADGIMTRRALTLSSESQHSLRRLNESLRLETRSLARMARTDPLTGVLNRKGLADELVRLGRLAGDAMFPVTLMFIDIDHFKHVNDIHGHDVGDQVIKSLATLVRSAVQRDDLFARWGGEEFLLVFRNMAAIEARGIAERLRERIALHDWPESLEVTCSFGVAEWHRGEDISEGVKRADEAMYRAKQNGRDRVEIQLESASDQVA